MKMSKPGLCCDSCFGLIAKRSTSAAKLWLDLCDLEITCGSLFGLKSSDFPTLRLLEILGFVLTTDTPQIIIVRVKGKRHDAMGTYFCGGTCGQE